MPEMVHLHVARLLFPISGQSRGSLGDLHPHWIAASGHRFQGCAFGLVKSATSCLPGVYLTAQRWEWDDVGKKLGAKIVKRRGLQDTLELALVRPLLSKLLRHS